MNLQYLKDTVKRGIYNRSDEEWKIAFIEYNKVNKRKLGMNCTSCYNKVLNYLSK